ncbi:MAG: UDP-N-acetylmuramoyl-L-alanyl-D-glutamate--2,6-diaminopimelate ligase [Frankiaceae bacterium]|nr:UDP-N-acetylmuramoyl-L-alanyl-D-glutamate--2,6-diaminopimelate ligase [Frankiaceae bacterium]
MLERLPGARLHGDGDAVVTGITHDSRAVRPGDVYLARPGEHAHGIDFVAAAVEAGAVAVVTDAASVPAALAAGAAAVVEVADPRAAAGPAAAWVYGDPARDLDVIGVTGTNGKTTTTYLLDGGLRASGRRTGLVGTGETRIGHDVVPSARTTPEATDLQALFAVMRERDVDAVAMEVSSHALALDRVAGTTFAVAAFTNLSQDHLDFHVDMDDYFAAKARLFTPAYAARAVVAVDDEWGRRLAGSATVDVTSVGAEPADWVRVDESVTATGGHTTLRAPDGAHHDVEVSLPGRFNVRNAAVAYVALVLAGIEPAAARAGIASVTTIPGRMQRVDAGQPFLALVDYAHTPAAVTTLLAEVRGLAGAGRVVVVLGCGGDRDRGKRPLMGAAAARGADVAVLTNDNPRSEDPLAILAAMEDGARASGGTAEIVVEPDRRRAIALAVGKSSAGDVLVVAGKGHEQGQEQDGVVTPFDDGSVLREALGRVRP